MLPTTLARNLVPMNSGMSSLSRFQKGLLTGGWLVALQLLPAAQCPVPDQLDAGACQADATQDVPGFPRFTQDSLQICWLDCSVDQVIPCRAEWVNLHIRRDWIPSPGFSCEPRYASLRIVDANGMVIWLGYKLTLEYSRTWLETDNSGAEHQVWRFLVNGDLIPGPGAASPPCSRPACVPALGKARFTGYVDYARACASGSSQFAWMLSHLCDRIDHFAGFPRAGTYHPDRSFTLVGPALGFVPGAPVPIEATGGAPFDALRQRPVFGPATGTVVPYLHFSCATEEPSSHTLLPVQESCLCTMSAGPAQFAEGLLTVAGSCGSTITSPGGPYLSGFLSMALGAWTDPSQFPGEEALRWNAGNYSSSLDAIYFGVTTVGGWAGTQILAGGLGSPLPSTYIDQGSSNRMELVCEPRGCCVCWKPRTVLNLPYLSDAFINLNH